MKAQIGLFGFGVVGQGFYHILAQKNGTAPGRIARICVRTRGKKRTLPEEHFTYDPEDILGDPAITHIIELTDRPDDAFRIVETALKRGKTVISANKKMLSDRLCDLLDVQRQYGGVLLYEASACGSIPIFQNLEHFYAHDEIQAVEGIFNGSTNYILSQMTEHGLDYGHALSQAQQLGFAETDPSLDVDAHDPAAKLALLIAHAFGCWVRAEQIFRFGIRTVHPADIQFAARLGRKIRLVNTAARKADGSLQAFVMPVLVRSESPFHGVQNAYNAVRIESRYMHQQVLTGLGAGSFPTGFAVLSDLAQSLRLTRPGYNHLHNLQPTAVDLDIPVQLYWRCPDPAHEQLIPFSEIVEENRTPDGLQRIGNTRLRHVADARKALLEGGNFVGLLEIE